jgi:hypothetical protein
VRLTLHILKRRAIKNDLQKRATSKISIIQDVKWNMDIQVSNFIWKRQGTIQMVLEAARPKQTSFELELPRYNITRNVLSHFARFIETIEKDMVTLAIFEFRFCNVLKASAQ